MKTEFELTLDHSGRAVITFKHHDKDSGLEQKVLGVFLKEAATKGIVLEQSKQYAEIGVGLSYNTYEISVDKTGRQEACNNQHTETIRRATFFREECEKWHETMLNCTGQDGMEAVVKGIKYLQDTLRAKNEELTSIREYIGADDNESTFDEVQRLMQKKH